LFARGNFVFDAVFPSIDFVPTDRAPNQLYQILSGADKLAAGMDVTNATKPEGKTSAAGSTSVSMQADRDEDFNMRLASYHAWRKAIEKVKPIARTTTQAAVDHLLARFLTAPVSAETRQNITALLAADLGTGNLTQADSYTQGAAQRAAGDFVAARLSVGIRDRDDKNGPTPSLRIDAAPLARCHGRITRRLAVRERFW
jgi:hypothetical protein